MRPTAGFWRGRRVLLTGHTGFKGGWLAHWLNRLGARVHGLALPPDTEPSLALLAPPPLPLGETLGDIAAPDVCIGAVADCAPEIVLHLAAQPLVRRAYRAPKETYSSNVMGTLALLDALRAAPAGPRVVLVVTTDKVYRNDGSGDAYREDDPLGGHDPYSASKAATEILVESHRASFFAPAGIALATARAGNVIGGGDWAADRLIPDAIRSRAASAPIRLRYPEAVRPWQHVLDPLAGYLAYAEALATDPEGRLPKALNFGPDPMAFLTVSEVVERFYARFEGNPGWIAEPGDHPPEAAFLTLSSRAAESALGWRAKLDADTAIAWAADWYRDVESGAAAQARLLADLDRFLSL